uniref:SEH1 like nucleoporin n=1 Tax=Sciurus vulgaris TaxID=55149 RepID=A0A8D2CZC6_SCIVU
LGRRGAAAARRESVPPRPSARTWLLARFGSEPALWPRKDTRGPARFPLLPPGVVLRVPRTPLRQPRCWDVSAACPRDPGGACGAVRSRAGRVRDGARAPAGHAWSFSRWSLTPGSLERVPYQRSAWLAAPPSGAATRVVPARTRFPAGRRCPAPRPGLFCVLTRRVAAFLCLGTSQQGCQVWDKSESGDWHCTVLASCSFDRTAAVWEEIVGESNDKLRGQSHWVKRTTLVDSRTSVTDVKFAPKHMGLMLATCSADGVVRIYEAPDVMNLSQWSLQHEISCKLSCSCISWNPSSSRAHSPMIAVGRDDSSPNAMAKVQIFEYYENTRKYAKAETLMTVTDPPVRKELTSSGGPTKFEIHIVAQFDNHNSQVWRVSWNITGTVLASSGDDGCVRLWKANYMDNWKCTGILKGNRSPVSGSSQQGNSNPSLGSTTPSLQNSLNGSSASRKHS